MPIAIASVVSLFHLPVLSSRNRRHKAGTREGKVETGEDNLLSTVRDFRVTALPGAGAGGDCGSGDGGDGGESFNGREVGNGNGGRPAGTAVPAAITLDDK